MLRLISWLTAALLLPLASVVPGSPAHAAGPHLITVIAQGEGNAPVSGMQVSLYYGGNPANPPAANAYNLVETATTDANGWATFSGRPDGYYKVQYMGTSTFAPVWWDNGATLEDAAWFGAGELNPNPTIGPVTMDDRGSASGVVGDQYGGGLPATCWLELGSQSYYLDFLYGRQLNVDGLAPGGYSGPFTCPGQPSQNISFVIGRTSLGGDPSADLGNITYSIPYSYNGGVEIVVPPSGFDTLPANVTGVRGEWDPAPRRFEHYWTLGGVTTVSASPQKQVVEADRGKTLAYKACVASSQQAHCTASAQIVIAGGPPSAPTNTSPPTISGTPQVGATLTASPGSWSPSTDLTYTYQWRLNGSSTGMTGASYVVPASAAGKAVSVLVTATTSGGGSSAALSVSTVAVTLAMLTVDVVPKLAGVARAGKRLSVQSGRTTPNVKPTFAWFVGSTLVAGATGPTFKLTKAHVGRKVRVVVRYAVAGYATREFTLASKKVKAAT